MPLTPVTFDKPELQSNETFKQFDSIDALGTSYLDLHSKVSTGSLDLLPEEMRKDPAISRYKNLTELGRGLVETQKMVGSIEKAPEKPEGYKFTPMANLHPNLKADGIIKELLPVFHAAGAGNKLADSIQQGLITKLNGMLMAQDQARKDSILKSETELRTAWGGEYDAKLDKITKTIALAGGPEVLKDTEQIKAALKGSPVFLKAMGKLVGFLSEDSLKTLGEDPAGPITDAKAAQGEIDKFMQEITSTGKKHPYWNEKDAKHEEALKKMHDLHALLGAK